jgi:hypothetical protein
LMSVSCRRSRLSTEPLHMWLVCTLAQRHAHTTAYSHKKAQPGPTRRYPLALAGNSQRCPLFPLSHRVVRAPRDGRLAREILATVPVCVTIRSQENV